MGLIDLDTLKQNLCGDCTMNFPKECRQIGCTKVDKKDILEALRLPIIDAVPVIRCKDCKHYYALNEVRGNCSEYNFVEKIPIDFCSWAERKEHETD